MNNVKVRIYKNDHTSGLLHKDIYLYFYKIDNVLYGQRINGRYFNQPQERDKWEISLENENDYIDKINQILVPIDNYTYLKEVELNLNCYYPRITWSRFNYRYRNDKQAIQFFESCRMLMLKLHTITYTVNPSPINDLAYGHELRALLLLICMEIENNFVTNLKENGYLRDRYNTSDFIKLKDPLNLNEIEVEFEFFTEYPSIKPFLGWNEEASTQSLSWYDAYNKTKHSREDYFSEGNLKNVLYSMAGLIALLYVQFRTPPFDNSKFNIDGIKVKEPNLKPEQVYLTHPLDSYTLEPKKLFE